jgi:RecB family endonuclease NucS
VGAVYRVGVKMKIIRTYEMEHEESDELIAENVESKYAETIAEFLNTTIHDWWGYEFKVVEDDYEIYIAPLDKYKLDENGRWKG